MENKDHEYEGHDAQYWYEAHQEWRDLAIEETGRLKKREELLQSIIDKQDELISILKEQIQTHEKIRVINEEYIKVLKDRLERK